MAGEGMTGPRPSISALAALALGSVIALAGAVTLARRGTFAPLPVEWLGIAIAIAAAAHLRPRAAPAPAAGHRPWVFWAALILLVLIARIDVITLGLYDDGDWAMIFASRLFTDLRETHGYGSLLGYLASTPIHLTHAGLSVAFAFLQPFFGASPPPYHLLSLIVYGLAACALFSAGRRITADDRASFLGAALFALHPRLWEIAAVPSTLCWSLLTVLVVAGILAFVRYLEDGRRADLVLSCILVFAATYVREVAFLAPLLMLAAGLTMVPPERRHGRLLFALAPHALIALVVLIHLAGPGVFRHAGPAQAGYGYMKMARGSPGMAQLLYVAFVKIPSRIAAPFGAGAVPLSAAFNWLFAAVTVAGAGLLAVRGPRFGRAAIFPIAFLVIAALPVSGAWWIGGADDRHLVWVVGAWSLFAMMALAALRWSWHPLAALAAGIAIVFQGAAMTSVHSYRLQHVPLSGAIAQIQAHQAALGPRDAAVIVLDDAFSRRDAKTLAMAFFVVRPHGALTILTSPAVVEEPAGAARWRDRPRVMVIMLEPSCRCWTMRPAGEVIRAWAKETGGEATAVPGNAAAEEIVGDRRFILTGTAVHFSSPFDVFVSS